MVSENNKVKSVHKRVKNVGFEKTVGNKNGIEEKQQDRGKITQLQVCS